MDHNEEMIKRNLEGCSYRFLQQTAKAMGLPSNVKKVYLIQLIYTMKYRSQQEVDILVRQVRQERQHQSLARKRANKNRKKKQIQQSTEISSTSNSLSPPITKTPKRVGHILIRYSPEMHSPVKYPRTTPTRKYPLSSSDRVLRSFNRVKKPSYLLNNALISLLKSDSEDRTERVIVSKEQKFRRVNRTYVRKKSIDGWGNGMELVPVRRNVHTSPPPQVMKQRRISGIYPLRPEDMKVPNVSVRRADGTICKLNAIIQKPLAQQNYNYERPTEIKKQSLLCIESDESTHSAQNISELTQNLSYRSSMPETTPSLGFRVPNISEIAQSLGYKTASMNEVTPSIGCIPNSSTDSQPNFSFSSSSEEMNLTNAYKENQCEEYAVYYHKKIRAEHVRSLRSKETARCEVECQLPRISEVFSKFSSVYKDVTQPLYVQVDTEPETAPLPTYIPEPRPQYQANSNLEKLYNLRNISQSLLQISTTTSTRTVYSTPLISSAKAQPSLAVLNVYNVPSPADNQQFYMNYEDETRVHDFFRNFRCDEDTIHDAATVDFRRSSSSLETLTSQEPDLGANVTIPEMVEDALELISQDGDYMERMGMDVRMQCIFCNWAGPKIILEYHIRKEHPGDITVCPGSEWCSTYSLGGLAARRRWLTQLLEHRGALYVLSAKYQDPDYFMAALTTLSSDDTPKSGSMTVYNKVTGEPFCWQGTIGQLPPCMPYDCDPNCFRVQLSRCDLLPNSANLTLINRELVLRSPNKVVVGQPELDSIYISLMVKIFD